MLHIQEIRSTQTKAIFSIQNADNGSRKQENDKPKKFLKKGL